MNGGLNGLEILPGGQNKPAPFRCKTAQKHAGNPALFFKPWGLRYQNVSATNMAVSRQLQQMNKKTMVNW